MALEKFDYSLVSIAKTVCDIHVVHQEHCFIIDAFDSNSSILYLIDDL